MLNEPAKEFTKQENILAEVLDELGIRYAQQVQCGNYRLDFLAEGLIPIEADGMYGHFGKRERERDNYIESCYNSKVIHIKSQTKEKIMQELGEKLQCLD